MGTPKNYNRKSFSTRTGWPLSSRLCSFFSEKALRRLLLAILFLRPLVVFILSISLFAVSADDSFVYAFFLFDVVVSLCLLVGAIGVWLIRHWTVHTTVALLAFSITSPIASLGIAFASETTQDFSELALSASGIFPPIFLFIGLTAYNLFSFGVRYTNTDGRIMPRSGRILLYFGVVTLVISMTVFYLNQTSLNTGELNTEIQESLGVFFSVGAVSLIPLYLIWFVWRRRDRLIGYDPSVVRPKPSGEGNRLSSRTPSSLSSKLWAVSSIPSSLLGILLFPLFFCSIGIVLGVVGYRKGATHLGTVSTVIGVAALILGLTISASLE